MLRDLFRQWMNHPRFDKESLLKLARLAELIPQKLNHFQLDEKQLADQRHRRQLIDAAVNVSLEHENFRNLQADELFNYATRLEEKYAGDIGQLKFLQDHLYTADGFYPALERAYYLFRHFDEQEEVMRFFEKQESTHGLENPLRDWMRELDREAGEMDVNEKVLASWFVHFSILCSLPALKRHAVFARFAQTLFLNLHNLDGAGMLGISYGILPHQSIYKKAGDQLRFRGTDDLPHCDLSNLLSLAMNIHLQAMREANTNLRDLYQDMIEYEDMTPRQRNMVNFFFDEGFLLQKPDTASLNERQQKIIDLIYENHFVSTKDLSLIFRCNRKTIQRDFTELLDMGLVRQMGNGAALRYTVSLKNNYFNPMERLQNIRLGEIPVQISLFGDSGSNKKVPDAQSQPGLF